jgi:hypothetical protein
MLHPKMLDQFQLKRCLYFVLCPFHFFSFFPSPILSSKIKLLDVLFTSRFQNILKRSDSNILSLLACGAVSTHESSRKEIAQFAQEFVNFLFSNAFLIFFEQKTFFQNFVLLAT